MTKPTSETKTALQCPRCGRFARFVRWVPFLDDFGGTMTTDCKKCGLVTE